MRIRFPTSHLFLSILSIFLAAFNFSGVSYGFEEYTTTSQSRVSTEGANIFRMFTPVNLRGEIVIEVWDQDECLVKRECWAKANTQDRARDFIEMVEMDLERANDVVTLELTTPHPAPWEGSNYGINVILYVFIPPNFTVETKTQAFDLDIHGPIRRLDVQSQYGDIQVSDISEETGIIATYGQVNVEDVRGALNVETSYNAISVRNVDTDDEKAFLKTSYGIIDIERFEGQLDASTVYSSIDASDLTLRDGKNEFKTIYSKIDLDVTEIKNAQLYVQNTYGNVNLVVPEDLSARLKLTVGRGGKIITRGIIIRPTVLNRTTLEGISGEEKSVIAVDVIGIGQIRLEGK